MRKIRLRAIRVSRSERARARVEDVPGAAAAAPLRRPVRVQVDAAAVLARPRRVPVRVQIRDDPQIDTRAHALKRTGNRDARALAAVDATDDQHPRPLPVASTDGDDRSALLRAAKHQPNRPEATRARSRREPGAEDEDNQRARNNPPHALAVKSARAGIHYPQIRRRSITGSPTTPIVGRTSAWAASCAHACPCGVRCGRRPKKAMAG
jgi:hypothetical protein